MMKKIEIDGYKKNSSNGAWTEQSFGSTILKKGTKLYHYTDTKIKKFAETETCFFINSREYTNRKDFSKDKLKKFKSFSDYEYILITLEDIEVEQFGDDEIRIDLEENKSKVEMYHTRTIKEYITDEMYDSGRYGMLKMKYFEIKNIK